VTKNRRSWRFFAAVLVLSFHDRQIKQKLNSAAREIATLKELLAVATANLAELRERLADMQAKIEQLQRDAQPGPPPNRKASAVKL
jgi:hypothetical protein